jgi:hypothetical protein
LGGLDIVYVAISSLAASYVGATITACPFDIVGADGSSTPTQRT